MHTLTHLPPHALAWPSVDFPLCQIDVPVAQMAERLGFPLSIWEEDGLGQASGFACLAQPSLVIFLQELELELAPAHRHTQGPTIFVDATELAERGLPVTLARVLDALGLQPENLTWRQTDDVVADAQQAVNRLRQSDLNRGVQAHATQSRPTAPAPNSAPQHLPNRSPADLTENPPGGLGRPLHQRTRSTSVLQTFLQHPRRVFAAVALISAGMLAFGILYLQNVLGLAPCPMCIVQRECFIGLIVFCVLGALFPKRGLQVTMAVLGFVACTFGAITAARQSWLQWNPPEFATCGRDLYGMIESFPLQRLIPMIFKGSGDCSAVDWTFLGLTIANWGFIWFVIFGLTMLTLVFRRRT